MDKRTYVIGFLCACAGAAVTMISAPNPADKDACGTYKVRNKVATSYVLKPPPAEVVYKACPQTTEKVCVSPKPESDTQPDLSVTENTQKPRRHRRHRVRRYW